MYAIKKSKIHGNGIITNKSIKKHKKVGIVLYYKYFFIPYKTDNLGKYLNHSFDNNCRIIYKDKMYYLLTTKDVKPNEELTINYDDTPWFILGSWFIK